MNRYIRKTGIIYIVACVILLGTNSGFAVDLLGEPLDINLDFTYASNYMWHGMDIYNDHGAFQPSVRVDYRGAYASIWGSIPDSSGFDDLTEIDWIVGYNYTFFEESPYAVEADLGYTYFSYPKTGSDFDAQETALSVSFPNLIPLGSSSLVPGYAIFYDWDGVQSEDKIDNGWFQTFSLNYDFPIPTIIPDQEEQALTLYSDLTYNDGAFETDSGWSHATVGISTTFEWKKLYFTPALYYQFTFEDSVNTEDDLYTLLSVGFSF